ncbi:hypothetical protein HDU86_002437 [Geranomyces michiganensis]|nr:hypothetical protein HDU86_002437 [Geranomyces michiganensis]
MSFRAHKKTVPAVVAHAVFEWLWPHICLRQDSRLFNVFALISQSCKEAAYTRRSALQMLQATAIMSGGNWFIGCDPLMNPQLSVLEGFGALAHARYLWESEADFRGFLERLWLKHSDKILLAIGDTAHRQLVGFRLFDDIFVPLSYKRVAGPADNATIFCRDIRVLNNLTETHRWSLAVITVSPRRAPAYLFPAVSERGTGLVEGNVEEMGDFV